MPDKSAGQPICTASPPEGYRTWMSRMHPVSMDGKLHATAKLAVSFRFHVPVTGFLHPCWNDGILAKPQIMAFWSAGGTGLVAPSGGLSVCATRFFRLRTGSVLRWFVQPAGVPTWRGASRGSPAAPSDLQANRGARTVQPAWSGLPDFGQPASRQTLGCGRYRE